MMMFFEEPFIFKTLEGVGSLYSIRVHAAPPAWKAAPQARPCDNRIALARFMHPSRGFSCNF